MVDVSSQNGNASIKVSSSGVTSSINATPDMALYYSEKSREYSESAKKYADEGKGYLDSAVIIYNDFDNQSILTLREIASVKSSALEEFNVALAEGKDVAVGAIEEEKTSAINAIDNEKNIAIQKIDDAFAELGGDLSDVKIVADNIETVQTIGQNVENILNKTVEVGDTLTSEAGTSAKVVNVGTKFAPVLEFTIPQGAKGVDGKDGKDGADGGMSATFEAETQTLSFSSEKGTVLNPHWGNISGDITQQADLQAELAKYLKGVVLTQADYDALATKDANTLYFIEGE